MTSPNRCCRRRNGLVFGITVLLSACQITPDTLSPANIPAMTPAQLDEVQKLLADAVGQPRVTLSAQAFADTHILVLEPAARRTPLGTVATGTTTTTPPTFHLLGDGRRCQLHDLRRDVRHNLSFECGEPL